jgi:uncharacterized membrane protein
MNDNPYQQSPPLHQIPQNSTMAMVSMIAGIVSYVIAPLIGAIVAIITGHMAKREIRESNGQLGGDGMATAGLVLGYLQIIPSILCVCAIGIAMAAGISIPLIDSIISY